MEKQDEPTELISERAEERKIPVFTVLKNKAILKNIFLLDNPALVEEPEKELEEILVVGRHPDCNITLEHPSISRFHLRIHSNLSSQSLSVVDLSSVHGTWIAGKKIEPGVQVKLQEGDTFQLGGSSRVYRLHWIPLSRAYDLENPFIPPIQESESSKEGEGETHQVEDGLLHQYDETLRKNDKLEGLDSIYSDTDVPTMRSLSPVANEEGVECKTTYKGIREEDEINIQEPDYELDKEKSIQESSFSAPTLPQAEFETENAGTTPLRSEQRSVCSIWSRRGNTSSVLIQTDRDAKQSSRVSFGSDMKSENNADTDIDSFLKGLDLSGDVGGKMSTPDKESRAPSSLPLGSLKKTDEFDLGGGSKMESSLLNLDEVGDEIYTSPNKEDVTMNIHLLSADQDEEMFTPDKQTLTPNKENQTPSSVLFSSLFDLKSGSTIKSSVDDVDDKIVIPDEKNVALNILPLNGRVGEEMFTPDKENLTPSPLRSLKNTDDLDLKSGSTMKSSLPNLDEVDDETFVPNKENVTLNIHFHSGDIDEEEMSTPGKENCILSSALLRSLKKTSEVDLKSQSTMKSSILNMGEGILNMGEGDNVLVTPNKENVALDTLLLRSIKQKGDLENIMKLKVHKPSPLKNAVDPRFNRDKGNCAEKVVGECDEDIFTPDKENMTPNAHFLYSMNKIGKLEETSNLKVLEPLPLEIGVDPRLHQDPMSVEKEHHNEILNQEQIAESAVKRNVLNPRSHQLECMSVERENHNEKVLQEQILIGAVSRNKKDQGQYLQCTQRGKMDRVPFQTLLDNSNSKTESNYSTQDDVCTKSIHHNKYPGVRKVYTFSEHIVRQENKRWCMVVDTTTLLNKESRKALQLVQGLKWTCMIIPRIVIRELDCMKRRASFFRRNTEVASVLEWIEDCMKNAKWWIHEQSSEEEASTIVPTPPATPTSLFSGDSLSEIVSPTAEDHILEYALSLRKINTGQQLILLSDDVTLKIKSMAEGLLCETATEFRESLVNPFSERFLWTESSPRGTTWSSVDDVVLKETYYQRHLKKPAKFGESAARGLKLILLHNSHYRHFSSLMKV